MKEKLLAPVQWFSIHVILLLPREAALNQRCNLVMTRSEDVGPTSVISTSNEREEEVSGRRPMKWGAGGTTTGPRRALCSKCVMSPSRQEVTVSPVWWGWLSHCRCCRLGSPGLSCPCLCRSPSSTVDRIKNIIVDNHHLLMLETYVYPFTNISWPYLILYMAQLSQMWTCMNYSQWRDWSGAWTASGRVLACWWSVEHRCVAPSGWCWAWTGPTKNSHSNSRHRYLPNKHEEEEKLSCVPSATFLMVIYLTQPQTWHFDSIWFSECGSL